nr:GtrA family protein [Clostridium beijerinckii]
MNFLIIGCINAVNGIIFSYIYSIFLAVNISFIIGYITAMSISYILNSVFVFKECASWIKYMKFCISYIPNFIVQNICVLLLYNLLEWNKILVFILAAIIGVPITFILMKFYAFNCNKI